MADKTLTIVSNGSTTTKTFNRDRFAGLRTMSVDGQTVTVNRTAPVVTSDRAGESRPLLSKLVGGAAAAYSLRDLNDKQGNNKVVRVRRESDNHERDFLAKEISNGTLESFVNSQVTAPLDIQALTSTGRDGGFLIAKAAYSLRSLGTRQATVAATGDTVARADGKYVCQVRRDSDDALKSFTADEVTDGTLLSFVNEDVTVYTSTFADDTNGWSAGNQGTAPSFNQTVGGVSPAISWTGQIGTYYTKSGTVDGLLELGQKVRITGKAFCSTSTTLKPAFNFNTVLSSPSQALVGGEWSDFDFTLSMDGFGGSQARIGLAPFSSGTAISSLASGVTFALADLTVQIVEANGFVKTWYDQSVSDQAGNTPTGNHATQANASDQPKIVNAGALIDGGSLRFDDSKLGFTQLASEDISLFSVVKFLDSEADVAGDSVNNEGSFGIMSDESYHFTNQNGEEEDDLNTTISTADTPSNYNTLSAIQTDFGGGVEIQYFTNGIASEPTQAPSEPAIFDTIGSEGIGTPLDGNLKEFIIYASSQTDNRAAIEANIGEHHSISGIPAFDNSVNGFVETWYDQSGNGNDATQSTAASQPKIVNAGSLLTAGVTFDGGDSLSVIGDPVITASNSGTFSAFSVQTVATNEAGYLYGNASSSNGSSLYAAVNTFALSNKNTVNRDTISRIVAPPGGQNLLSAVYNNGDAGLLVNGAGTMIDNSIYDFSAGSGDFIIGNRNGGTVHATFLTGSMSEIIIYVSNQEANRPAIEANLANQYGITLS